MRRDSTELRTQCPDEIVSILDAVSLAQGLDRGQLVVRILKEWAEQRHREAIVIARVMRGNPTEPDSDARSIP
ncbi:MAG: hypothetical protein RI988_3822 [Pseudomonadota bacterium]|jgi:hypothetical protein